MNNIIRNKPYYKGVTNDLKSPTQANKLTYTPGTIVEADDLNLDPDKGCGAGINFCSTLAGALKWARCGTVVTVTVPDGEPIVDTGDKLRAKRVLVGEVVSLRNAYLVGANLTNVDLRDADLSSANLRDANLWDANLTGADLTGANLWNADLSRADLGGANLRDTRGSDRTILPKHYKVVDGYVVREAE